MSDTAGFRVFRFLVAGYTISSFGNFLNLIALPLFAYKVTGSPLQTGLFLMLRLAVSFFGGSLIGYLAGRVDRKALMVASDLAQATSLVLLIIVPAPAKEAGLYALAVVFGLGATTYSVSLRSAIPELVGVEQRVRANGLLVTSRSMATVLGLSLGGILVSAIGFEAAFLTDAATFLISAAILATLRFPRHRPDTRQPDAARPDPEPATPRYWDTQRAAFSLIAGTPALLAVVVIRGMDAFGSASHQVGMPVYASIVDPENPGYFMSTFLGAWAVGSIIAYRALSGVLKRDSEPANETYFAIGTCFMSLLFTLAFTGPAMPVLLLIAMGAGVADGFTEISYTSRMQAFPSERRSMMFGLSSMVESLGLGVGMLLSAWLMGRFAPLPVVAFCHGIAMVIAVGFLVSTRLRRRPVPAGDGHQSTDTHPGTVTPAGGTVHFLPGTTGTEPARKVDG